MAGYIAEFFGYRAEDKSEVSLEAAVKRKCPFLESQCAKVLSRDREIAGVCAIRQKTDNSATVICCPNRIYADNYKMLHTVSYRAFGETLNLYAGRVAVSKAKEENGAIAVFGHGWGGELRLPQRKGTGSYFVDWVLAKLDEGNIDGSIKSLDIIEEYCTTVYKIQEAFSALNLPEGNVYRDAIRRSLYG